MRHTAQRLMVDLPPGQSKAKWEDVLIAHVPDLAGTRVQARIRAYADAVGKQDLGYLVASTTYDLYGAQLPVNLTQPLHAGRTLAQRVKPREDGQFWSLGIRRPAVHGTPGTLHVALHATTTDGPLLAKWQLDCAHLPASPFLYLESTEVGLLRRGQTCYVVLSAPHADLEQGNYLVVSATPEVRNPSGGPLITHTERGWEAVAGQLTLTHDYRRLMGLTTDGVVRLGEVQNRQAGVRSLRLECTVAEPGAPERHLLSDLIPFDGEPPLINPQVLPPHGRSAAASLEPLRLTGMLNKADVTLVQAVLMHNYDPLTNAADSTVDVTHAVTVTDRMVSGVVRVDFPAGTRSTVLRLRLRDGAGRDVWFTGSQATGVEADAPAAMGRIRAAWPAHMQESPRRPIPIHKAEK